MIQFKAKPWKNGDSWVVTIPKSYVDNELLDPNIELIFEVREQ